MLGPRIGGLFPYEVVVCELYMKIEVCIDNIEPLYTEIKAGANRINVQELAHIGVRELQLSGKVQRPSRMAANTTLMQLGKDSQGQSVSVAGHHKIEKLVSLFTND